jgi:hypothetical protein
MQLDKTIKQKKSLGTLRQNNKTKPKSPDLTGQMKLQRHTAAAIVDQFSQDDIGEVVCNLAGWKNQGYNGPYLTVELSPLFVPRRQVEGDDIIDSIINGKEEDDIEDI